MSGDDQLDSYLDPSNERVQSSEEKWKQEAEKTFQEFNSRCPGSRAADVEPLREGKQQESLSSGTSASVQTNTRSSDTFHNSLTEEVINDTPLSTIGYENSAERVKSEEQEDVKTYAAVASSSSVSNSRNDEGHNKVDIIHPKPDVSLPAGERSPGALPYSHTYEDAPSSQCQRLDPKYNEMMTLCFHLYVHHDVEEVTLEFEKPLPQGDLTYRMDCMSSNGYGRHWTRHLIVIASDFRKIRYRYRIKYHFGTAKKISNYLKSLVITTESYSHETRYRTHSGHKKQYDVFHQPTASGTEYYKGIFGGQFFYVKMLCGSISNDGENLKEILIECQHVGFGDIYGGYEGKQQFFKWINEALTRNINPFQCAYICCLLGQFNKHNVSSNFNSLLDEENANLLLIKLRCCSKVLLPQSSLEYIKQIQLKLLFVSSYNSNLDYICFFGRLFDSKTLFRTARSCRVTNKEHCEELLPQLLSMSKEHQEKEELITYIISNAPSIPTLWKIFYKLGKQISIAQSENMIEKFKRFILERNLDIGNPSVWKEVPRDLRPKLAIPFVEAVTKHVQRNTHLEERLVADLVLDKDLQEYAFDNLLQLIKFLSQSKIHLNLLCDILNAQNFYAFWQKIKKEDELDIVHNLTLHKAQSKLNAPSMTNKQRVVAAFQVTEELIKITVLKKHQDIVGQCVSDKTMRKCGLKAVVDAYDEVFTTTSDLGKKWYLDLLRKSVESNQVNSEVKSKLINNIFPSRSQTVDIDRGREAILLLLLDREVQAKKLDRSCRDQHAIEKLVNSVLSEKDFWSVVFQAKGNVKQLQKHDAYMNVKKVILNLSREIVDGQIPLHFVKGPKDEKDIAELLSLGRCIPPGTEKDPFPASDRLKQQWMEVLASLSKERENISKLFDDLGKAINIVNEVTGEGSPVVLQDVTKITNEYNARKTRLPKTKFVDIRDEKYWGDLECLLKPSKELNELSNCTIFRNLARKLLEEQTFTKVQNKDDDQIEIKSGDIAITVEAVLQLLLEDGMKIVLDFFKRLDSKCQISSQELDRLISGIKQSNIKEEVEKVCKILKLKSPPMRVLKMMQQFVQFDDIKTNVDAAEKCLVSVGYCKDSDFLQRLNSFLAAKDSGTLETISSQMEDKNIARMDQLSPDLVDILKELSEATELVEFIIKTAKDNMVDLIEAVEEHSDQLIQETTVSYLIDVHRFLRGLLSNKPDSPEMFLDEISKTYSSLVRDSFTPEYEKIQNSEEKNFRRETKMAAKIKVCSCNVHSLQGLHMMLSNRGEMTKEIIKSAISNGSYRVEIDENGFIHVQLMYTRDEQNKSEAKHNLDDLNDLRSRALLLVNAEKKSRRSIVDRHESPIISQQELRNFIEQVDLITEIVHKYSVLKMFGIPKYEKSFWKNLNSMEEIIEEEKRAKTEVENWKRMMSKARKEHFFLNYFHAKQLWMIKSFFQKQGKVSEDFLDEVLALFHCIDTNITRADLSTFPSKYRKPETLAEENELNEIGEALEKLFKISHEGPSPIIDTSATNGELIVPGKLYIGVLEPGSVQTVHVVMALFRNTCARLPKSSQLLFCHSNTTWEEIELLLLRTFEAHRHGITSQLHCIANVETLPNDIQFRLVDTLKVFINDALAPYLLAVVCRGGSHHYIADQFCDHVHHFGGIPDADLRDRFSQTCQDTFLVTGDLPGLGKSEVIYSDAASKGRAIATFPISGPFVRKNLVQRLSKMKLKHFQSIHFDIGEVDDPLGLDTFLFELIVTKMVSTDAMLYSLPTNHVYIEIANTLQQSMRNSLPVCKCFKKLEVSWKDYSNLLSSKELTSPIQLVCQYLHANDCGTLENKEICFNGAKSVKALSSEKCRALLKKHFFPGGDLSFNILEAFTSVLADQLMKFTRSPYLKPQNLKDMFEETPAIRTRLFKALLDVATSFAARSVITCKATQANAIREVKARNTLEELKSREETTADKMVDRVNEMIQWTDNEHLVIMLHGAGAITAIYRDLKNVPQEVKDLFKSQAIQGKGLEDYKLMSQEELQVRLQKISDSPLRQNTSKLSSLSYALTPDNILKMALIIQRMQARVPVIVMGETGCGKTSLVRYLAQTCAIPFEVFSFHAGITEAQIYEFIIAKDKQARSLQKEGKSMWVFLDEINTCDYLGAINEVVCHRSMYGKPLACNLMFVAACNPYRIRPSGRIMTAGLTGKTTMDEFSKLVYRVHPLPETMIDYVWDYGSLSSEDERAYIGRMVERIFDDERGKMLVDLLAASQEFIRSEDKSSFCVSLRDVNRTTILMKWFHSKLKNRPAISTEKLPDHIQKFFITARRFCITDKAIVLSLAHCYLTRLPTSDSRQKYCKEMTKILVKHGKHQFSKPADSFQQIIRAEQEDYLSRMELPEGTAKNAALRENVFVILVCILNRIPVFVVGKPGCSKSLSMQVIRSNLRGRDSKDQFLKTLPQLFVVSFQGSESSTSEGIEKVFEKARKYKNKSENVLPVVLLDEIGLAEISKFNPLKVLHRLLEPGEGEFPDVAVVGISNWALDAAKMNRAIHLSRPEPDQQDLFETGLSIREAQVGANESHLTRSTTSHIKCLAEAYHEYQSKQEHDNFHGLRDYYSMVKCLDTSGNPDKRNEKTQRAMERNFGGISSGKKELQSSFFEKLKTHQAIGDVLEFPVTDLICENLNDKMARHLMIITSGDSAIEILDQTLKDMNKEKITIFGSHFEEDLSADYSHRILSRIILCMEHDCILILRDLESIYGSLYDMLNQNYIIVGGKKNCRVALGAFSNPMCQVDDGFRCIVLVDESKVNYSDPPFLNRFEKQLLRFSDVLNDSQREIIKKLEYWTKGISTIEGHENEFDEYDMFGGFHDDTLPSLVLLHSQDRNMTRDIMQCCKQDLMAVAMPDAVVRSRNSKLFRNNDEEVAELYEDYFKKPIHDGLKVFLSQPLKALQETENDVGGMKLLVMTHSSIHTNVSKCIEDLFQVQVEKMSFFKSEKELSKRIKHFWMESSDDLLVVQCRPETDAPHMLLLKTIIEETRKSFIRLFSEDSNSHQKHVCLVIHLRRTVETEYDANQKCWQFNFLSGWKQVMIDTLEKPIIPIKKMLECSVNELLQSETNPFSKVAADQLLWCFTRIKSPLSTQLSLEEICCLVERIKSSSDIMKCFMEICCEWVEDELRTSNSGNHWQIEVACDRETLINSSTLVKALQYFISHLVRRPLARIVYFLHWNSAWRALMDEDTKVQLECLHLMSKKSVLNIDDIPEPQNEESLVVDIFHSDLHFPFSCLFCKRVDNLYGFFCEEYRRQCLENENLDENEELTKESIMILTRKIAMRVEHVIKEINESDFLSRQLPEYVDDFLDIKTECVSQSLSRRQRIDIMKANYGDQLPTVPESKPIDVSYSVAQLHVTFWLNGNTIPRLFYFIQACLSVKSLNIDECLIRYYKSKEAFDTQASEDDHAVDEPGNAEDNEELISKLPQIHEEKILNSELLHYSVEESQPNLNESFVRNTIDSRAQMFVENIEDGYSSVETEGFDDQEIDQEIEEDQEVANKPLEPGFEECLVREVCLSLLPTDTLIETVGGIEEWKRIASLVLSSATKYCCLVPVYYYLKVCSDFATLVLSESKPYRLFVLGELGSNIDDNSYLDSQELFDKIYELVQELRNEVQDKEKLDEFLFLFFERCIESNPDYPLIGEILRKITSLKGNNMLKLASSILHQILLTEEDAFSPENVENLITIANLNDFPNLMAINDAFSEVEESDKQELDCHVAVICCDLINKFAFKDLDITRLQSSDDQSMRIFKKSLDIVLQSDEECKKNMFCFICAVAFIKAFLSELSRLLIESGNTSSLEPVLKDLSLRLKNIERASRVTSVSIFFLKELGKRLCLYDVKQLIQSCEQLHPLQSLGWEDTDSTTKLSYDPFQLLARNSDAETALGLQVEEKESNHLKTYFDSAMLSYKERKMFASVIVEQFYLPRSIRKLKDTEDKAAKIVAENLPFVSKPYNNFVVKIAGQESFMCGVLEISPESRAIDVEVAVLLQHLSVILTSGFDKNITNPIICCLTSPELLNKSYVLVAPENELGYHMFKLCKIEDYSKAALYLCECGMRFAYDKTRDTKCLCSRSPSEVKNQSETEKNENAKGYVKCNTSDLKNELLHVRNLDPIEFRILHFLVHSALYAGYSLGLTQDALANLLKSDKPSETCYETMQIDLEVLTNIMCCKKEKTITLLHHVFEKISPLLTEDTGLPFPCDEEARLAWERCFAVQIKSVLQEFRKNSYHFSVVMDQNNKVTLESILEERTLDPFGDAHSRNVRIPRLFRTTQSNTLKQLREVYMNSADDVKAGHPLLGLFLDYHESLKLVSNLAPLISWSRRVDILLTRALTRAEASKMKIIDVFTKGQQLQEPHIQNASVDMAREEFEKFRKAWENIVPLINTKLQECNEMPYITEMYPVGYCLTEKQDYGRYLCTSLNVLADLQNEFLDKCLTIATSGDCDALQFLSKEGSICCLPTVHIQDAKEKEVIQYEWSDNFLGHSLYATEYGQGNTIMYDMGKIEKDMAGCFLLGKAYLSTVEIREFAFSKQLFHDCADILNKLSEAIPQENIPSSVEAELTSSATKSIDRIQILLEYLELILCCLKRTGAKPEESLIDYVDTWMSSSRPFPKDLFPKTLKVIQVKHTCALYEFVEDKLAVPSIECVPEDYRKSLLSETEKQVIQTSQEEKILILEAVVVAIKRFVFRYLNMKPHPDECLVEFMKDPSLWPMTLTSQRNGSTFEVQEAAAKFFPKEVTIGHVYKVNSLYQKRIDEINSKHPQRIFAGKPPIQRSQTRTRPGKKRSSKAGGYS